MIVGIKTVAVVIAVHLHTNLREAVLHLVEVEPIVGVLFGYTHLVPHQLLVGIGADGEGLSTYGLCRNKANQILHIFQLGMGRHRAGRNPLPHIVFGIGLVQVVSEHKRSSSRIAHNGGRSGINGTRQYRSRHRIGTGRLYGQFLVAARGKGCQKQRERNDSFLHIT